MKYFMLSWLQFLIILSVVFFLAQCSSYNINNLRVENSSEENILYKSVADIMGIDRKCCPIEMEIYRYSHESSIHYECKKHIPTSETPLLNTIFKPKSNLHLNITNVSYGFPTECDKKDLAEVKLENLKYISKRYCADRISKSAIDTEEKYTESIVGLICKETSLPVQETSSIYQSISRCCPKNKVFDVDNHICVEKLQEEEMKTKTTNPLFAGFLLQDILFSNTKFGVQLCMSPKFLMEYVVEKEHIFVSDKGIKLSNLGKNITLRNENFCMSETTRDNFIVRTCRNSCEDGVCVTKCCPEGQVYVLPNNTRGWRPLCSPSPNQGFSPTFYNTTSIPPVPGQSPATMGIRYTPPCSEDNLFQLDIRQYPEDANYLDTRTGNLFIPGISKPIQPNYCMEVVDSNYSYASLETFVCSDIFEVDDNTKFKLRIYCIGLFISCIFLIATLLVHVAFYELQTINGRIIICHVASLIVAYAFTARVKWDGDMIIDCKFTGYIIYFSFLAAFSWLNCMCFDIWKTVGNLRSREMEHHRKRNELKKFIWFSVYSWGFPLILTLVTLTLDIYDIKPGVLDAQIGVIGCWFSTDISWIPILIFFNIPIGLQTGINIVFFALTAIYCHKVKTEIHRMQTIGSEEQRRKISKFKDIYAVNLKLFTVMGITWIFEALSPLLQNIYIFFIFFDILNVLRGIFIFCILILNKKICFLIKRRFGF